MQAEGCSGVGTTWWRKYLYDRNKDCVGLLTHPDDAQVRRDGEFLGEARGFVLELVAEVKRLREERCDAT